MLIAAYRNKDRHIKLLCEDEITSCVFWPLSFFDVGEVWTFFRKWLPFSPELWPKAIPTGVSISFWENLSKKGPGIPDIVFRFVVGSEPLLTIIFEVKWDAPLSDKRQLVNQWAALKVTERQRALHVYLVKNMAKGNKDVEESLKEKADFTKKEWRERLICVGWRDLIETLRSDLPTLMNLWGESVRRFLKRGGLTTFTGFEWLTETIERPKAEVFWKIVPWFSGLERYDVPRITTDKAFWMSE